MAVKIYNAATGNEISFDDHDAAKKALKKLIADYHKTHKKRKQFKPYTEVAPRKTTAHFNVALKPAAPVSKDIHHIMFEWYEDDDKTEKLALSAFDGNNLYGIAVHKARYPSGTARGDKKTERKLAQLKAFTGLKYHHDFHDSSYGAIDLVIRTALQQYATGDSKSEIKIDQRLVNHFDAFINSPFLHEVEYTVVDENGKPVEHHKPATVETPAGATPRNLEIKMYGSATLFFNILENGSQRISDLSLKQVNEFIADLYKQCAHAGNVTIKIDRRAAAFIDTLNFSNVKKALNVTFTHDDRYNVENDKEYQDYIKAVEADEAKRGNEHIVSNKQGLVPFAFDRIGMREAIAKDYNRPLPENVIAPTADVEAFMSNPEFGSAKIGQILHTETAKEKADAAESTAITKEDTQMTDENTATADTANAQSTRNTDNVVRFEVGKTYFFRAGGNCCIPGVPVPFTVTARTTHTVRIETDYPAFPKHYLKIREDKSGEYVMSRYGDQLYPNIYSESVTKEFEDAVARYNNRVRKMAQAQFLQDKISRESKPLDGDPAFANFLPALDDLNDVDEYQPAIVQTDSVTGNATIEQTSKASRRNSRPKRRVKVKRNVNGAKMFYVDGKRTNRDRAWQVQCEDDEKLFCSLYGVDKTVGGAGTHPQFDFHLHAKIYHADFDDEKTVCIFIPVEHFENHFEEIPILFDRFFVAFGKRAVAVSVNSTHFGPVDDRQLVASMFRTDDKPYKNACWFDAADSHKLCENNPLAELKAAEPPAFAEFEVGKTYLLMSAIGDSNVPFTILKRTENIVFVSTDDDLHFQQNCYQVFSDVDSEFLILGSSSSSPRAFAYDKADEVEVVEVHAEKIEQADSAENVTIDLLEGNFDLTPIDDDSTVYAADIELNNADDDFYNDDDFEPDDSDAGDCDDFDLADVQDDEHLTVASDKPRLIELIDNCAAQINQLREELADAAKRLQSQIDYVASLEDRLNKLSGDYRCRHGELNHLRSQKQTGTDDACKPIADADKTFIAARQREIDQLIETREKLTSESCRLKIDELIRRTKQDMIHRCFAG